MSFRYNTLIVRRVAGLILIAFVVQAADIPMTLISDDEAEPIHSAIMRKEAWTQDAVRRLRAEAEKRLKEGPWSVTSERPKSLDLDLDVHDYYSQAPYWWPDPTNPTGAYVRKDGQIESRSLPGQQKRAQCHVRRGVHAGHRRLPAG